MNPILKDIYNAPAPLQCTWWQGRICTARPGSKPGGQTTFQAQP